MHVAAARSCIRAYSILLFTNNATQDNKTNREPTVVTAEALTQNFALLPKNCCRKQNTTAALSLARHGKC